MEVPHQNLSQPTQTAPRPSLGWRRLVNNEVAKLLIATWAIRVCSKQHLRRRVLRHWPLQTWRKLIRDQSHTGCLKGLPTAVNFLHMVLLCYKLHRQLCEMFIKTCVWFKWVETTLGHFLCLQIWIWAIGSLLISSVSDIKKKNEYVWFFRIPDTE